MAWEDRLDEELFWHDLANDRRNQRLMDEQDARRSAEARQHAKDIAALQGTVDELKDQLTAERKARARAEQDRADAEARFRFEMWRQTENGRKYLEDKKAFLAKAAVVKELLDAIDKDGKDATERWVYEHGLWPNPAYYGLDDKSQLLRKPLFNAEGKRQKAIKAYNDAVAKALKAHRKDATKWIGSTVHAAFSAGFWVDEYHDGLRIIKAVEKENRFDQAGGFSNKEIDSTDAPISILSYESNVAKVLTKVLDYSLQSPDSSQKSQTD